MATLRKGKVIKVESPLMEVLLISGHRFWTNKHPKIDIYDFVWVAWDYTKSKPAQILTKQEMEKLVERSTESSPLPMVEDEGPDTKNEIESENTNFERLEVDTELTDYGDIESFSEPEKDVLEEYEERSFSDPCHEG